MRQHRYYRQYSNNTGVLGQLIKLMSLITYSDFTKCYRSEGSIGSGNFGRIIRIRHIETNTSFALKKLKTSKSSQKADILRQIQILKKIHHPLITKIFEYYEVEISNGFMKSGVQIGIIMELGLYSLEHSIKFGTHPFTGPQIFHFTLAFIQMLSELQTHNIVHRDIKPANIIVFGPHLKCKLADFGLCCQANKIPSGFAGTFHYVSPKVKKKFTNPKLKIQSNPFKDDVYSLGVTVFQLTTRQIGRKEILHPYSQILHISQCPQLAEIIELMLQPQEEKRPTFQQLTKLFDCSIQEIKTQEPMEISQTNYFDKPSSKEISLNEQLFFIEEKTIKKVREEPKYQFSTLQIQYQIQSISSLDNFLILGCANGQIKALELNVKEDEIVCLGMVHYKYVSVLQSDIQSNIWSAGGNSTIIKWNSKKLIWCLKNKIEYITLKKSNWFAQSGPSKMKKIVDLSPDAKKKIEIPFSHPSGVSCMSIRNEEHIAVGFHDGFIYLKWKEEEAHLQLTPLGITCLKVYKQTLYCGGMDGIVRSFDLRKMQLGNKLHKVNSAVMGLETYPQGIGVVTFNGTNQFFNNNFNSTFKNNLELKKVLACAFTKDNCLILSQGGQVCDNKEVIVRMGSRGWNCIAQISECKAVVGSFEGKMCIIEW